MRSTERCPRAGRVCGSALRHRAARRRTGGCVASLVWLTLLAAGCASSPPPPSVDWEFFAPASPERDAWYPKVAEWQTRARVDPAPPLPRPPEETGQFQFETHPAAGGLDPLPEKLGAFALAQRRLLAERIFHWTRRTSAFYYQSDRPGSDTEKPVNGEYLPEEPADDHWPTYSELVEQNGDDCDGLDLVAYRMLQEFGFPQDELFRGVMRRNRDAANHMVTFWFEDPSDPWVFDATGAATQEFRRFSEISGWTPTTIFNESHQYAVRQSHTQLGRAAQAGGAALD